MGKLDSVFREVMPAQTPAARLVVEVGESPPVQNSAGFRASRAHYQTVAPTSVQNALSQADVPFG